MELSARVRALMKNSTMQYDPEKAQLKALEGRVETYNRIESPPGLYHCPKCKNRRDFAKIRDGRFCIYNCDCVGILKFIRAMEESGLQDTYERFSFDTFRPSSPWQEKMLRTAREFCEKAENNSWLFFGGQCGAGKTHLATAVCYELLHRGKGVVCLPWVSEINNYPSRRNTEQWAKRLEEIKGAEVLFIDDVFRPVTDRDGSDLPSAMEQRLLQEILDYRYTNRGITIFTCERSLSQILEINEGIGSRIKERCKGYSLNIKPDPGRNYRLNEAPE